MTREEWIAYHDKKSPHDPYTYEPYHCEMFDADNGIMRYTLDDEIKTMYITEIIGNFKFWLPIIWFLIKAFNIEKVVCWTHRSNPKPVARLFLMNTIEVEKDDEGGKVYRLTKEIKNEIHIW